MQTSASAGAMPVSTPDAIGRALGARPICLVAAAGSGGLAAAHWHIEGHRPFGEPYPCSILAFRAGGSAAVTKVCGGRAIRRRPALGAATFIAADAGARWELDADAESLHVYLPVARIEAFAAQQLDGGAAPRIDDFFAIEDAWLQGYFRMLLAELESCETLHRPADTLLLEQTEHLVLRHLMRWHSDAGSHAVGDLDRQAHVQPLRPALQRRIEDFVRANLARDITLADLAQLCSMSVDHFLRAFRVASGITPHRYVLEQRLRHGAALLRESELPVAEVARRCAFRSASHFSVRFHARFNASPTDFRRRS